MNFIGLVYLAYRNWFILLVGSMLGVMSGLLISYYSEPSFIAESVITSSRAPNSTADGALSGLARAGSILGLGLSESPNLYKNIAYLESRETFTRFVKKEDRIREIFYDRWDTETESWKPGGNTFSRTVFFWKDFERPPTIEDAYQKMHDYIYVDYEQTTGIIKVAVSWKDPEIAAEWANDLIKTADELLKNSAQARASGIRVSIEKVLGQTNSMLVKNALARLLEKELYNELSAGLPLEFAFEIIEAAFPPIVKAAPRPLMLGFIGLLAGLFAAFFIIVFNHEKRALVAEFRSQGLDK